MEELGVGSWASRRLHEEGWAGQDEASEQSPAVPAASLECPRPCFLSHCPCPGGREQQQEAWSCAKEVAGVMIPEEIQRLLEGNHKILLPPLLRNGGKLL